MNRSRLAALALGVAAAQARAQATAWNPAGGNLHGFSYPFGVPGCCTIFADGLWNCCLAIGSGRL